MWILNYIEYKFGVYFSKFEKQNEKLSPAEFSKRNYPFSDIAQFLIILCTFNLIPTEFSGRFNAHEF